MFAACLPDQKAVLRQTRDNEGNRVAKLRLTCSDHQAETSHLIYSSHFFLFFNDLQINILITQAYFYFELLSRNVSVCRPVCFLSARRPNSRSTCLYAFWAVDNNAANGFCGVQIGFRRFLGQLVYIVCGDTPT